MFIAEVYAAIATRFKEFQSKNKAAKVAGTGIKDKEMGLSSMRALITALPQYHEILSRMTLHIQVVTCTCSIRFTLTCEIHLTLMSTFHVGSGVI